MKLTCWNVNGIRAALRKDFAESMSSLGADALCLQETKANAEQCAAALEPVLGERALLQRPAERAGYSGVATIGPPGKEMQALDVGIPELDAEGRAQIVDFGDFRLVNLYVPNAQNELRRLPLRERWDAALRERLTALDADAPLLVCGDFNCAHQEMDLARPRQNRRSAGFSDEERAGFGALLGAGFADVFRELHPERIAYSWWSYRARARERNVGWRIDYWLCSRRLLPLIKSCEIRDDIHGSDHCPVTLEIAL